MTRYLICSAQRTGSNLLCDLLAQTKQAGIRDVTDGHFYLGHGKLLKQKQPLDIIHWFEEHATTPNGVQGCKGSFEYFDTLHEHCGAEFVDYLLSNFTHFIYLTRHDLVAQAVSWALASQTKHFSSLAEQPPQPAEYSFHRISYFMGRIQAQYIRFETLFAEYNIEPLTLVFEDWTQDFNGTLQTIFQHIGLPVLDEFAIKPTLRRQVDSRKKEWQERYREERNHRIVTGMEICQ